MSRVYLASNPAGPFTIDEPPTPTPAVGGLSAEIPVALPAVPTLEATHTWDSQVVLHDHRPFGDQPYRLRCRSINLRSLPEAQLPADPRVGGTGMLPRPGRRAGKVVTYSGAIEAVDAAAMRAGTDALEAAFWDVSTEREVLVDDGAGQTWRYAGRGHVTTSDAAPGLSLSTIPTPYQVEFTVGIQLADPRIYSATDAVSYLADGELLIGGGVPTALRLRLHGPAVQPVIVDTGRDVQIALDLTIASGAWVDIDLGGRQVRSSTGADLTGALRWPESTWWASTAADVTPGVLSLQVTGTATPRVDAHYAPAFP